MNLLSIKIGVFNGYSVRQRRIHDPRRNPVSIQEGSRPGHDPRGEALFLLAPLSLEPSLRNANARNPRQSPLVFDIVRMNVRYVAYNRVLPLRGE
jgi:hypothetical protein